jgi:acyl carrier protein
VPRKVEPAGIPEFQEELMKEIESVVRDYILREFLPGEDPAELTEETPLITGGVLDSISTLKLVVFLEERFEVTVEAHEAGVEHLDSVAQIAQLITEKKNAA